MIKKYKKPKIISKKLKLNYFFNSRSRDSFSLFSDGNILAQSFDPDNDCGCGGCGSCCSGGCFLEDTKIYMADRTTKKIQQIKAGDTIGSYDILSKNIVNNKVKSLLIHPDFTNEYYVINRNLKVTGNHRMWVNGEVWERVDLLVVGDRLMGGDGCEVPIITIEKKLVEQPLTVYNIHTKYKNHNYLAENFVAHNPIK